MEVKFTDLPTKVPFYGNIFRNVAYRGFARNFWVLWPPFLFINVLRLLIRRLTPTTACTSGYKAAKAALRRGGFPAEKGLRKTSGICVVLFVVRSKTVTPNRETPKLPDEKNLI